jgi:hypothetical protein
MAHHNGKSKSTGTPPSEGNGHHWLTIVKQDVRLDGNYDVAINGGGVHVHCHACPECNLSIPLKSYRGKRPDPSVIGEVTIKLAQYRIAAEAYMGVVKELQEQMGFTIDRSQQPPRLSNIDYGIAMDLKGDAFSVLELAKGARELYEEKWLSQEYDHVTPVVPAQANGHKANGKSHTPVAALPFELPEREKNILVLDSCLMGILSEQRARVGDEAAFKISRTWLEMLNKTAELPNVTLVVPSLIADWELQGKTAVFRPDGKSVKVRQVDENSDEEHHANKHYCYKVFEHFFKDASRARLGPDGQIQMIEGKNKKLIIWESAHDREIHTQINRIIGNNGLSWGERWRKIDDEVRHHDEGEKCIEAFLRETPFKSPVMILSQDHKWFDSRKHIQSAHNGLPAGEANFGAYAGAELKVREAEHCNALKEPAPLHLDLMMYRINDHRVARKKGLHSVTAHSTTGAYSPGIAPSRPPETIEQIIQRGVELAHGKYDQYLPTPDNVLTFLADLPWQQEVRKRLISASGLKDAVDARFPAMHTEAALQVALQYLSPEHSKTSHEDIYQAGTGLLEGHDAILFRNALTDRLDAKYAPPSAGKNPGPSDPLLRAAADDVAAYPIWDVRKSARGPEVFASAVRLGSVLPHGPAAALLGDQCHALPATGKDQQEIVASPWLAQQVLDRQPALADRVNDVFLDALETSSLSDGSRKHYVAQITTTSGRHRGNWSDQLQKAQREVQSTPDVGKR